MAAPGFKPGAGSDEQAPGGFDSHTLPSIPVWPDGPRVVGAFRSEKVEEVPEHSAEAKETTAEESRLRWPLKVYLTLSTLWRSFTRLPGVRQVFAAPVYPRTLLLSALVGVVAAFVAATFYLGLAHMSRLCLERGMGYVEPPARGEEPDRDPDEYSPPSRWWAVLIIPTLGGLVCGVIVWNLAPEAEGHGTDAVIRAFHRFAGRIRPRVPWVKGVASVITIGTGGSAGREGPIAQIAAGVGSWLATALRLGDRERRILTMCGASAGIGSIFHSPLGGALFGAEVLYSTAAVEHQVIIPATIASVVAYSLYPLSHGAIFKPPPGLRYNGPVELVGYLLFALFLIPCGWLYVRVFYGTRDLFARIRLPFYVKPALGGLGLGLIALAAPHVMGGGYGWVQRAMDGALPVRLMLFLAVAKILATALTVATGGSGGVFAPSLFIGAMLGGAFGQILHGWAPALAPQPEAFVLVGMSGFFAGVAKVPLTVLIMVCEMTGSYSLIAPLMLVNVVTMAFSRRWQLYEEQVPSPADSPAHAGEVVVDVLERLRVKDVFDRRRPVDLIPASASLNDVREIVAQSRNLYFPVVDRDGNLIGIFSLSDLRPALMGIDSGDAIRAIDIATFPVLTVTPEDDLAKALRILTERNIEEVPVVEVDAQGRKHVVGFLSRRAIINAYKQAVEKWRRRMNLPRQQEESAAEVPVGELLDRPETYKEEPLRSAGAASRG